MAIAFLSNKKICTLLDHRDGNKINNSLYNLRWCDYSCNNRNGCDLQKKIRMGIEVCLSKNVKYVSHIRIHGRKKHLGYFNTIEEASNAYEAKFRELDGSY